MLLYSQDQEGTESGRQDIAETALLIEELLSSYYSQLRIQLVQFIY